MILFYSKWGQVCWQEGNGAVIHGRRLCWRFPEGTLPLADWEWFSLEMRQTSLFMDEQWSSCSCQVLKKMSFDTLTISSTKQTSSRWGSWQTRRSTSTSSSSPPRPPSLSSSSQYLFEKSARFLSKFFLPCRPLYNDTSYVRALGDVQKWVDYGMQIGIMECVCAPISFPAWEESGKIRPCDCIFHRRVKESGRYDGMQKSLDDINIFYRRSTEFTNGENHDIYL